MAVARSREEARVEAVAGRWAEWARAEEQPVDPLVAESVEVGSGRAHSAERPGAGWAAARLVAARRRWLQ